MRMFIGRKSNNCIRKDMNQIVRRKAVYGFLLPSFAGVCIFYFIPYIDVFRRAFFSAAGGEFQGLDNFKTVLTNPAFQLAVKNTGLFILVCIPLLLSLSLVIAVWIYRHSKIGNFLKTGFLLPMAIPVAAVVLIGLSVVLTLLGGLIPSRKAAKSDPVIALRTD